MQRNHVNNSLLMNHLDGLKAAIEGSESAGKLRLEVQLSEALKECSALRNALKEEKDKFKEHTNSLERQTNKAKERMLEEKSIAEKCRAELEASVAQIEEKDKIIMALKQKIRESDNYPTRSVIQSGLKNIKYFPSFQNNFCLQSVKIWMFLQIESRNWKNKLLIYSLMLNVYKSNSQRHKTTANSIRKLPKQQKHNYKISSKSTTHLRRSWRTSNMEIFL